MARRDVSRRRFLHLAALAGGGAALAACGATPTPEVVTQIVEKEVTKLVEGTPQVVVETVVVEKTVAVETIVTATPVAGAVPRLRYLTDWYGGDRGELMSQFLGQWAEERSDVAIIAYEPAPEVGDRLLVEFAAGTSPDIFLWSFVDTPEFGDWLLDMAPLFDADPDINEDDLVKNHPIFYENGQKKALPFQGLFFGASINIDLFEQAGLPMPWEYDHDGDKWWNWDDWLQSAIAIDNLGDDIWGCTHGNDVDGPNWFQWVYSNGGKYVDQEKWETTLASDEATFEAMTFLNKIMCEYKCAVPFEDYAAMQESLGMTPEAAGKVGIPRRMEEAHWRAAQLNGQRVAIARAPRTKMGLSNHNHQPNCISVQTAYQKEAWELGKFLCSYDVQLAIGLNGTSQPTRKSVIESAEYMPDAPATAKEAFLEQVNNGDFYPIFLGWREWRAEVRPIVEQIFTCEGSPEQVLAEADEVGTAILKSYNS